MNTLHLSVINDGASYEERKRIARLETSDEYKLRAFEQLCAQQAQLENRTMGTKYTANDVKEAAIEVHEYMQMHVQEGAK